MRYSCPMANGLHIETEVLDVSSNTDGEPFSHAEDPDEPMSPRTCPICMARPCGPEVLLCSPTQLDPETDDEARDPKASSSTPKTCKDNDDSSYEARHCPVADLAEGSQVPGIPDGGDDEEPDLPVTPEPRKKFRRQTPAKGKNQTPRAMAKLALTKTTCR